jgi:membrane associated rhomboid family serine protease
MTEHYSPSGFRLLPPVVKNLLIINALFFLATISLKSTFGIDLERTLGLYYFRSDHFQPYQFVTYMFIHGGIDHLIFNMFALWMFGYLLENFWGPKRFLTFYLLTGIGAGITQTVVHYFAFSPVEAAVLAYNQAPSLDAFVSFVNHDFPQYTSTLQSFITSWSLTPQSPEYLQQSLGYVHQLLQLRMDVPTVGASGAVYAILLAFGMMFPNMRVYLYFFIPIKAKWIVIGCIAVELFLGISNNPTDNIAHFAHLGGMIFGLILILYWRRRSFLHRQ